MGGALFGPECAAGILMGTIISGIQLAISMANSGGAWDNCKKSIKNNGLRVKWSEYFSAKIEVLNDDLKFQRKQKMGDEKDQFSDEVINDKKNPFYFRAESASISRDTVGDPLKDTSGPSLNILIKLSSILSVVFSVYFKQDYLIGNPKNNKPATPATPAKTK